MGEGITYQTKHQKIHKYDLLLTYIHQQLLHDLFHMVPVLTVLGASFFQPASFLLHQQKLQLVGQLNRYSWPKKSVNVYEGHLS